ncbi:hypothetical protein ACSBR1_016181 [Camellia fascicularis]
MAYSCPLTIFPNLNQTLEEVPDIGFSVSFQSTLAPAFNLLATLVDQLLATKSNINANTHIMESCTKAFTAMSNLSRQLQSRMNKVQRLSAQLFFFQCMYQDAR